MSVKNTHPDYDSSIADIEMLRDFYKGERAVKDKTTRYLTPTVAQQIDGMGVNDDGWKSYKKYIEGARFPGLIKTASDAMVGIMHKENAVVNVPERMKPVIEKITNKGESVYQLIRRINQQQLITGRLGLLLDADERTNLPYVSIYNSEAIRNWDENILASGTASSMRMVVLYEPQSTLDAQLKWEANDRYRVLSILPNDSNKNVYQTALFEDIYNPQIMRPVTLLGRELEKIPFVFVNAQDLLPVPDIPPLLGLANAVLGIYRSEANYRYHLYMQSQDTLVRVGYMGDKEEKTRTGAGAIIDLDVGGDARYIGVNSQGLAEERLALEQDYARAEQIAMKLLDKQSAESNEALMTRKASQTASLTQIAKTSAAAVETILKQMAEWMNLNPNDVTVTPFTDFGDVTMAAKEIIDLMTAKTMGAPLSKESIHDRMREGGITDKTLDDELLAIAQEDGGE